MIIILWTRASGQQDLKSEMIRRPTVKRSSLLPDHLVQFDINEVIGNRIEGGCREVRGSLSDQGHDVEIQLLQNLSIINLK